MEPPPKCTTDANCTAHKAASAMTDEKATAARQQFAAFRAQHPRTYAPGSPEEAARFAAFRDNMARAAALGGAPHYGVTDMADRTRAEFDLMAGYNYVSLDSESNFDFTAAPTPTPIDWVAKGAVTGPVDQGICGEYSVPGLSSSLLLLLLLLLLWLSFRPF